MIRPVVALLAWAVSGTSWAAAYNVSGHTVTRLATGWGGEGFYVATQGSLPAGANCGSGNSFMIEPGHPMQKEMVSLLLTAIQSQAPVDLYVDGCTDNGAIKLKAVAFYKGS